MAIFAYGARHANKSGLKSGIKTNFSGLRIVKNHDIMMPSNKLREIT
jgi:hypothetical protein